MADTRLDCGGSIVLRAPVMADAASIAKYADNRDVWINLRDRMPNPYSIHDAREWIALAQHQKPRVTFTIDVAGDAIGGIGLVLGSDIESGSAEVGYWVGSAYWGRGIATAALSRVCHYAFEDLGLLRVFATPITWNAASFRVLEKAGFELEGIMRNACVKDGKIADMALFSKIRHRGEQKEE